MRAPTHADTGFVTDEQIQVAGEVEIGPAGRVGRMQRAEAGGERHVLEGSVSAVVQQRAGKHAAVAEPGAAHDEDVLVSVVVVVGVPAVRTTDDSFEPGCVGTVDVSAPTVSDEEMDRMIESPRSREEIEEAVAI